MPDPIDQTIYATRLRPHRSLGPRGLAWVIGVFAAISTAVSIPFYLMGAWPVVGFFGLDVALVWFAFRANDRAARAYEDVSLTPLELQVAKVSAHGARAEWRFNPSWVRLEREDHEEFGTQRLALVSRGNRLEIAGFLGPDAKAEFAQEFTRALAEARRGPRYS
jgi:uncharacterized membrane protein